MTDIFETVLPNRETGDQTFSTTISEDGQGKHLSESSEEIPEKIHNIKDEDLIDAEIERVIEARRVLIRNECLKSKKRLDLGSSRIDDLDAITIAYYLTEKHTNLELIHLGANLITDDGLCSIVSGMKWHHDTLRELYLGNNNFTPEGISALVDNIIPTLKNIEILSLGNIGMNDSMAVSLSYSLMGLNKLKSLLLNSNNIGENGFISLSILISSNLLKAKTLHLGDNQPSSRGLICLFDSLQKNITVQDLYINDICLQNDDISALSKCLIKNKTLQQLNIGNCGLDDESLYLLKNGLMFNRGIKMLNLWGNRISDEGVELLGSMIQDHNHSLTTLTLSDNLVKNEKTMHDLKELLKQNQILMSEPMTKKIAIKLLNKSKIYSNKNKPGLQNENDDELEIQSEEEMKTLEKEILDIETEIELKKKVLQTYKERKLNQQTL